MRNNFTWMLFVLFLEHRLWCIHGIINATDTNIIVSSIEDMLKNGTRLPTDWYIFRVPRSFRESYEEIYSPEFVSIGPFHRGEPSLQPMEASKLLYVQKFFSTKPQNSIQEYVASLKIQEGKAREYYTEEIKPTSDEFVKMMLIDGVFIIEFMAEFNNGGSIITSPWLRDAILFDMRLVENQLPYFIIVHLFNLASTPDHKYQGLSLREHTLKLFSDDLMKGQESFPENNTITFVDFIRQFYYPSYERTPPKDATRVQIIPSATELHESGIKFKMSESTLLDVRFNKKHGVFHIPRLTVNDNTESILRNVMIYELFNYDFLYMTDYMMLMGSLINTATDVALLRDSGIIDSWMATDEGAADMFNDLISGTFIYTREFYYAALFEDVNAYYKKQWNLWITKLRRDYFNTPWSSISFVAASLALIFTAIQAYFSCFPKERILNNA